MKTKKVLIIIGKLYIGGAERVARDIGVFADRDRFEIHYLVFESDIGPYEPDVEAAGCRVIHMDSPSQGYGRYFRALIRLIRTEKYDVIHAHTMFSSGWAMLAGKLCGVPVRISHSHSIRGFEKRGFLKNLYEKTMRRIILAFATDLVACGRDAGEWLYGKVAFSKRGKLIFNGIDLDSFAFNASARAEIRERLGLQDAFVIGHVGHLATVKNQSFLLELLPELLGLFLPGLLAKRIARQRILTAVCLLARLGERFPADNAFFFRLVPADLRGVTVGTELLLPFPASLQRFHQRGNIRTLGGS